MSNTTSGSDGFIEDIHRSSDGAHTVFNQIASAFLICRNSCNTVVYKIMYRIGQRIN